MYCLYSVTFSFLIPETLLPFTFVFFVDLNPAKPIVFRISAISGSESTSISSEGVLVSVPTEAPFVDLVGGIGGSERGGGL